ncbi:MAG: DNA replication and repair protein RecF [Spirochaetales bacterium]|uniref:DNA replication and repair protein RecF n=1 Tax=Candidatus Thalassospirochaeta sargassi TaxID=3119039 RepID=A0AAJ1MJ01_9SPIO|nr:DNA replication and repair protein RecF [Spirochaetales bacterium]
MAFSSVRIFQFRNLDDTEIVFTDKDIYLIGENGQGKTNFLEAIYLLCVGSSFRTRNESLLIKTGFREMSLTADFSDEGIIRKIQFKLDRGKKSIRIDSKQIRDRRELLAQFPCIAFTHEDINYVNGPPALRRLFINQTISLYDASFIDSLKTYNRVIKLRNKALKERRSDLLDIYDRQAAESGLEVQKKRIKLIEEFNSTFSYLFRNISGYNINLSIRYSPSWKTELSSDAVLSFIRENRNRDMMYKTSTTGPHRDKIGFYADGRNYAATASTGQIRLISLVLRASQAAFTADKSGLKPVLLLDDVLLEMDLKKRRRFLDYLPEYKQAFFTFLPDEGLVDYKESGPLYRVENGRISGEEI